MAATNLPNQVNTDIRNAVNAGKVVTTQTQPVTYAGGQFTGYIVIDPATGSGAYLLGNGANGGFVALSWGSAIALLAVGIGLAELSLLVLVLVIVTNIISNLVLFWRDANCDLHGWQWVVYSMLVALAIIPVQGIESLRMFLLSFIGEGAATNGATEAFCEAG